MATNDLPDYEGIFGDYEQTPRKKSRTNGADQSDRSSPDNAASFLTRLALSRAKLFHSGDDSFASVEVDAHLETYPVKSAGFALISGTNSSRRRAAASNEALTSAVNTLAEVRAEAPEQRVPCLCGDDQHVWVDLGDRNGGN